MLLARISLIFYCHSSLSSIAHDLSSRLHPVSVQSCLKELLAGRPTLARSREGLYWNTSLKNSSLLFQQCFICLVRITWMFF